jgi:hypothetical protein
MNLGIYIFWSGLDKRIHVHHYQQILGRKPFYEKKKRLHRNGTREMGRDGEATDLHIAAYYLAQL